MPKAGEKVGRWSISRTARLALNVIHMILSPRPLAPYSQLSPSPLLIPFILLLPFPSRKTLTAIAESVKAMAKVPFSFELQFAAGLFWCFTAVISLFASKPPL
jgi:hypothetical protein